MSYVARVTATILGVVKESGTAERRVAVIPQDVARIEKLGFSVVVESGAGAEAGFDDDAYKKAGATIGDAWRSGLVVKIRPPETAEVERLKENAVVVSHLNAGQRAPMAAAINKKGITALALEKIPRITRAQKMDVLSSMANLSGYRAVLEAANAYQGFFGAQVTAAGTDRPAKVLIIGVGVAGLAAIGAAKALGAEVRAFDVRPATKEQVESLGATFLTVDIEESGDGGGGYAKTMSKAFIEAEMALFREQAAQVDVIITTALIPGKPAPKLLPQDVVDALKPGSVIVDLAAEQGGNCVLTQKDKAIVHKGITVIGYTDLPSRMAATSSRFFSANIFHLLDEMVDDGNFGVDLENEIVRAAVVLHNGKELPAPPRPEPSPTPKKSSADKIEARAVQKVPAPERAIPVAPQHSLTRTVVGALIFAILVALVGHFAPAAFMQHFTVFVLACFVGWQVVWAVKPALHTPLMSVTNAISGIIIVGGLLQAGAASASKLALALGVAAILIASINIAGGFFVTQRMLKMFRLDGGDK